MTSACSPCKEEIQQLLLNDNKTIVVKVLRESCGATVGFGYDIVIDSTTGSWFSRRTIFKSLGTTNLSVEWAGHNQLMIRYDEAHILKFTNQWWTRDVPEKSITVRITELQNR